MRYLILLITPLFIFASEGTLTPSQHNSVHGYNHRPAVKMQKKSNMHKMHKVDEKAAAQIVKEQTQEDVQKIELKHTGRILFYKVHTQSYSIEINAMDASVINKKELDQNINDGLN